MIGDMICSEGGSLGGAWDIVGSDFGEVTMAVLSSQTRGQSLQCA